VLECSPFPANVNVRICTSVEGIPRAIVYTTLSLLFSNMTCVFMAQTRAESASKHSMRTASRHPEWPRKSTLPKL